MQGIRSWYYLINLALVSKMRTDMLMLEITSHWDPQMDVSRVLQTERLLKYTGLLWRGSSLFFRLNKWLIFKFAFFFFWFCIFCESEKQQIRDSKIPFPVCLRTFAIDDSSVCLYRFLTYSYSKFWIIWPILMKLAADFMKLCEVKRGNSA